MKGYFISIEGSDGSGKSTQLEKMVAYLRERCPRVEVTREPGGTAVAEKIRELILDPENRAMTARAEMLLYAASRAQHVEEKILPLLEEGTVVVTDRFTDSSIAYQAYGRGLGDMVAEVNRIATGGLEPDLTIFLDLSPEAGIARKRREDRHELDRLELEALAFHEKVYKGYDVLCGENRERIVRIDADRPVEEVFSQIRQTLDGALREKYTRNDR
ncbi:dTMP kinase [Anaerotignum lactatifermentans]|uniref:Thymidylate kinase n=1 Tax=Anaerotignum lactatifermentans TaxID=160404 RepID=A0ABS2GDB4_9FIRM|nr:dTMP kinase [Anaerotignum lactatifermentans]MBM6830130.1 dTMP kinase [Anaerotignum lactatifermentans]MBM6878638.1 dTMP kinase [Anaerotignum lactatifermentans]MBM6951703.1 dTMP kinase [Anaerotignum lactatifermentans]